MSSAGCTAARAASLKGRPRPKLCACKPSKLTGGPWLPCSCAYTASSAAGDRAWLLKLAAELHTWDDADARTWAANLKPLADLIAAPKRQAQRLAEMVRD